MKIEPRDVQCEIDSAVEVSKIKTQPLEKAAIEIKLVKNTVIVTVEEIARHTPFIDWADVNYVYYVTLSHY